MTKDEALKMAIEALEDAQKSLDGQFSCGNCYTNVIQACKKALEQEPLNLNCKSVQKRLATQWGYVEQPAQEPVGFRAYSCDEGEYWHDCPDDIDIVDGRKLGEEFELLCSYESYVMKFKITKVPDDVDDEYEVECIDEMPKLYTHPAPSWQGLSDDEVTELHEYICPNEIYSAHEFARAIEQELKKRNFNE